MNRHIISQHATIIEALKQLNELRDGPMTLMAVGDDGRMTGTLTDGDIRRGLLAGRSLGDSVSEVMHRDFHALMEDDLDVAALARFRRGGYRLIPVLDREGHIKRLVDTSATSTLLPLRAVVMAGGRGERLRPLTLSTPKPLLKIGDKAIIDYNIAMLAAAGIDDITVTTHYLAEQLEEHFSGPVEDVRVKCVRETTPMGTIGAVSLADIPPEGHTLVMNSDLLTTISLEEMWLRHLESGAELTVAAIPYTIAVPYAILSTEGDAVTGLVEKPTYTHHANAGIYIVANRLLRRVNRDTRTDATDLMEMALGEGRKVSFYPINGIWIDIGSPNDYRQAQELMRYHSQLSR